MSLDILTQAADHVPILSTHILGLVAGLVILLLAISALMRACWFSDDPPSHWLTDESDQVEIDRQLTRPWSAPAAKGFSRGTVVKFGNRRAQ